MAFPHLYVYSSKPGYPVSSRILKTQLLTSFAWYDKVGGVYDTTKVSRAAIDKAIPYMGSRNNPAPFCVDIEAFSPKTDYTRFFDNVSLGINAWRDAFPYHRIGLYAYMPMRDYFAPVNKNSKPDAYAAWVELNGTLLSHPNPAGGKAYEGIADLVDICYPSIYTFYESQRDWVTYATENVIQARRYNKPIHVWIWPSYHQGGKFKTGPRPYIGDDYARLQIRTLHDLGVEGIVIYDPASCVVPDSFYHMVSEEFGIVPAPDPGVDPSPAPAVMSAPDDTICIPSDIRN